MIVLRMILGGILGLIAGAILTGLIAAGLFAWLGDDALDVVLAVGPFGLMLGIGVGATWQVLQSDKKQ